jgi:hypothetical protein
MKAFYPIQIINNMIISRDNQKKTLIERSLSNDPISQRKISLTNVWIHLQLNNHISKILTSIIFKPSFKQ